MKIESKSANELFSIGEKLGKIIDQQCIILLDGELGAGKTTFTKGLAVGLGVDDIVNSPTFTIAKTYDGRLNLNHLDVYRLEGLDEDFGIEDYMAKDEVLVVEWSKFLDKSIFKEYLHIQIDYIDDHRMLTLTPKGEYYNKLAKGVLEWKF